MTDSQFWNMTVGEVAEAAREAGMLPSEYWALNAPSDVPLTHP